MSFHMPEAERRMRADAGTRWVAERFSRKRAVAAVEAVYEDSLRAIAGCVQETK